MGDVVERLREACIGHPAAKIPWPHRLLHDAIAAIEARDSRIVELEAKIALLTGAVELVQHSGVTAWADTWSKSAAIKNLYKTADAVQAGALPTSPKGADQ